MRALFCVAWLAATAAAIATPATTNPAASGVYGQIAGTLTQSLIPNAPALRWTIELVPAADHPFRAILSGDGPGTQLRLSIDPDASLAAGTWTLSEAKIDLARWKGALSRFGGAKAAGLLVTGAAALEGHGTFGGGAASGEIVLSIHDMTVRDAAAGWTLAGISAGGSFAFASASRSFASSTPLTMAVQTITTKRFGARNLLLQGRLDRPAMLALSSGRVEVAGGDMIAAPCTVYLNPFRIVVDVTVNRIGLEDVAALVPTAVRAAHGRVDGTARIEWNGDGQPQLDHGHLVLRTDAAAEVTLRPFPGLFTDRLPVRVRKWLPNLANTLQKAELGQVPIQAKSLDVTFSHEADAEGRTAIVHLTGEPKDPKMHIPLDLQTNVHGPLDAVVQFVMANNVSVGVR